MQTIVQGIPGYELKSNFVVTVREEGRDNFVAEVSGVTIGTSGDTVIEALTNLQELISNYADTIMVMSDAKLGPDPLRTKRWLLKHVGAKKETVPAE